MASPVSHSPSPIKPSDIRILIVEDEGLVAMDLEERLLHLGYHVSAVHDNGPDALAHARAEKVDLALLDIHIHGKMDGIELAAALRESVDVPVIFLTAHADGATLARAGHTEPFGYVLKPFDERELRAAIEMAMYRHRAEGRVRKMENWLATTLRSIGDAVIATDSEGRITFINPMAEALTGWPRGEAVGHHLPEVFAVSSVSGFDDTIALLHRAMTDGMTITLGAGRFLQPREGPPLPIDDRIAPSRDDSGVITGCVVIFRDNTEQMETEKKRREMEVKMLEAQRVESLGVLAGGIAHDFNNLLVAVIGNASLGRIMVTEKGADPARLTSCFKRIEDAGQRAAQLCSQMLAYAGQGRFVVEDFDLSQFTRETIKLLEVAVGQSARLTLDLAIGLPPVHADRSQLQQVVTNLIINSAEAIGDQPGEIKVHTARIAADAAYLAKCRLGSDLPPGHYLLLEVSDTGSGMPAATLARIFDPFFSTKFTGRGLGLAAVLGIVRSHSGAIAVESAPGSGTVFRVLLPESAEAPRA